MEEHIVFLAQTREMKAVHEQVALVHEQSTYSRFRPEMRVLKGSTAMVRRCDPFSFRNPVSCCGYLIIAQ